MAMHLHRIYSSRRNQRRQFAVRHGKMGGNDRAVLTVALVRPVGQGHFQRSAQFRFAGAAGAPGHHRPLETEQVNMAEEMVPVFLTYVHNGPAICQKCSAGR